MTRWPQGSEAKTPRTPVICGCRAARGAGRGRKAALCSVVFSHVDQRRFASRSGDKWPQQAECRERGVLSKAQNDSQGRRPGHRWGQCATTPRRLPGVRFPRGQEERPQREVWSFTHGALPDLEEKPPRDKPAAKIIPALALWPLSAGAQPCLAARPRAPGERSRVLAGRRRGQRPRQPSHCPAEEGSQQPSASCVPLTTALTPHPSEWPVHAEGTSSRAAGGSQHQPQRLSAAGFTAKPWGHTR